MALVGLWVGAWAWPVMAQTTVYRCGHDASSYSQHPCAEGRAVDVADRRTPEQRAEAEVAASRVQRVADEAERRQRRASSSPRSAGALTGSPSMASQRDDVGRERRAKSTARAQRSSKVGHQPKAFEAVAPARARKTREP